ncbi:MAG: DUF4954 family protein [Bacteroidales bacterium]|nr:DUF4954 family protein [Bacteroidales bacterium]
MERVTLLPSEKLFDGWISPIYLPEGKDKYYLRNKQVKTPKSGWRHLRSDEIEQLVKNNNAAASWDTIWVTDDFEPRMVKDNKFYGTVRIGRVSNNALQFHDLRLPVGITNSSIHSCDIGDDCAIHDVHYLSHYIIGSQCMLFNIQEMSTTDHAKFGNGIVKDGENEAVRVRIQIMNEIGCRSVMPFDGMIAADAYMWGKYIDDKVLQQRLSDITQNTIDHHRGYYGTIGEGCVIKNSSIIKDVKIGQACYIKGASKLKNITINSSDKEPSQIGENVILVNGIVGYGCRIFYSCTAVKFVLGNNCNLKYGARLIDSIMGDNSTISCCEVLNNLIFPAHEQHHNNSFLIASVIMGQSNMAAGATIGSNHNSRTNDNEIVAGRGFWPGLCSSVKHSCKFASFTLLSKSDFPAEMIIPLPFSLVNNNVRTNELEVMPAYWWMYNMYALARNSWKYQSRDKRRTKVQNIEFDTFAPDSMEETIAARKLLEIWTAKAWLRAQGEDENGRSEKWLRDKGHELLHGDEQSVEALDVYGEHMEKSLRKVRILKVYRAYHAYGDMLINYAMTNILAYTESHPEIDLMALSRQLESRRQREWINLGGQLMMTTDFDRLRMDIREGRLNSWKAIHKRYNEIWKRYPMDKLRHAYLSLCFVMGVDKMAPATWLEVLAHEERIQQYIANQVYLSRKKDHDNTFRHATYRNAEEMDAAIGSIESNGFVNQMRKESIVNLAKIDALRNSLEGI